jgi:minor extracellular serine protease Vpr
MRNHVVCVAAITLFVGACSAPTETTNAVSVPPVALARFGGTITPRAIKPAKTPLGLDNTPVKVIVEVAGDPITVVQAQTPERKLTRDERQQIREALRGQQAPVRAQVEGLGGRVLSEYQSAYSGFAVHIARKQVPSLAKIAGVVGVHPLRVMKPTTTLAVPFVGAPAVWSGGVTGLRGEGLKVAILDTGIDYTHANFGGPGTSAAYEAAHAVETQPPDPAMIGPNAPRIKGGVDLVGDAYDASSVDPLRTVPHPDTNPLDCEGHGSHVAGIAAGSGVTAEGSTYSGAYDANTYSTAFRIGPGVAPKADLYAVRVFGCEGSTDVTVDAIEWAVDNDMDVINMSLGSTFGGADDPSAVAAANAVRAGVVVVASAGNDGTNHYMTGTPASGDGVISVAAMDVAPTHPGATLAFEGGSIQAINANGGQFTSGTGYRVVVLGTPGAVGLGCSAAEYARPDVPGALVVTMRGTCGRVERVKFGQAAGAAAVAMINTDAGFPPFEGAIAGVTIPFFGIRSGDAATLTAQTSLTATNVVLDNPGYREPASFTSGGPRFGDSALKPNLIAPGVGVVSTNIGTGNGALTLSGTSMSGPVVAGLATLARQAHSNWRAADVAHALTNTSDPSPMRTYSTRVSGVGVPQVPNAVRTGAVASSGGSSAVSFGFLEVGRNETVRRDIVVRNYDAFAMTFNVSLPANYKQGLTHDVNVPTQIRVPGRGTARLPISVSVSPEAAAAPLDFNEIAGIVELTPSTARTNRGVTLRIPYYAVVRPHARLDANVSAPRRRDPNGTATITNWRGAISGSADLYAWGVEGAEDDIGCNDVRAVGVQSAPHDVDDRLIVFAVNGFRRCSNHSVNEYDLIVTAESGAQYGVIGIDEGYAVAGAFNGTLATMVLNLADPTQAWLMPAVANTDTSTILLMALASQIGVTSAAPRFTYFSQTFNLAGQGDDPPSAVANYNAYASALVGQGQFATVDRNAITRFAIGVDGTEWQRTPARGLMIVFAENPAGSEQAGLFPFPAFGP